MKNHISHLDAYKLDLINKSSSPNTIQSYLATITHYFSISPTPIISRPNIQLYKSQISHLSPSTINQKLSALKSFNEYLLSISQIESILIIKQDFIKIQSKGNPTEITSSQVSKFLSKVQSKYCMYQSRNIALIYLMANTGIRREEVCNIKLNNLDIENEELTIIGKGNKFRTVLLNSSCISYIESYLVDRATHKNHLSPYLFISERGGSLTKETINDIFNFYCTPKNRITPHQLRHNFATTTIEQDIYTLPELQNQLGHSSVATTGMYAHARKSNMKKKVNNLCIG